MEIRGGQRGLPWWLRSRLEESTIFLGNGMNVNMLHYCVQGLRIRFQLSGSGNISPQRVSGKLQTSLRSLDP